MYTFQFRRGRAAAWAESNPVLRSGEPGLETDTGTYKVGDGTTPWLELPKYLNEDSVHLAIQEALGLDSEQDPTDLPGHIADPTPHPVYDNIQDLTLLFENGLI